MNTLRGTPAQGLFGTTLGFFFGFAAVALFGPTAARFQEVMQLSPLAVGFLVAMPALSGSLLRIPFAAWVDTNGGRKPFLVLLVLSIAGMSGLAAVVYFLYPQRLDASLYPLVLLLALLSGCGIATRHRAGLLLVHAADAGPRAGRFRGRWKSGARTIHLSVAAGHRRRGARGLLFDLARIAGFWNCIICAVWPQCLVFPTA